MSEQHFDNDDDDDTLLLESTQSKLSKPPMYKVIILNDDYTPMEFVVHILQAFFSLPNEKAQNIMINVHTKGRGVCGVYTRDIAETKVEQVNEYSRQNQHPLLCTMEAES